MEIQWRGLTGLSLGVVGSRMHLWWRNIRESCLAANCMRVGPALAFIVCPLDIRESGSQLLAFRSQIDRQWLPMVGTKIQTSGTSSCLALKNKTTPGGNQSHTHAGQKKAKLRARKRAWTQGGWPGKSGSHPFCGCTVSQPTDCYLVPAPWTNFGRRFYHETFENWPSKHSAFSTVKIRPA